MLHRACDVAVCDLSTVCGDECDDKKGSADACKSCCAAHPDGRVCGACANKCKDAGSADCKKCCQHYPYVQTCMKKPLTVGMQPCGNVCPVGAQPGPACRACCADNLRSPACFAVAADPQPDPVRGCGPFCAGAISGSCIACCRFNNGVPGCGAFQSWLRDLNRRK